MLEAHRARCDADAAIVERADERVDVGGEGGLGKFFREAPKLAAAVDRRAVVQEHGVGVAAFDAVEFDGDDLTGFGVVAEAGRVRHADEFVFDDRFVEGEGLGNDFFESFAVGAVGDDQVFAVYEAVGTWGEMPDSSEASRRRVS